MDEAQFQDTAREPSRRAGARAAAVCAAPRHAIAVEDLHVTAGGRELLHGVSAEFPRHAVTAIIGPTGCGKTTLLRCLNRMHDATPDVAVRGRVLLGDMDVYRDGAGVRELRRQVGMVFQRPNPFPQSILENLVVGPRVHGLVRRSRLQDLAEERLREVGLWEAVRDRLKSSPFSLSGGQQQLLCLARALSVEPAVLLLDEPTSSLDPATTAQIEHLIARLKRRVTVVIVSHNLGQVRRVADRVLFLLAGERVELSDAAAFFERPADERSRSYIGAEVGAA
jgi:phosphate transport system ATP-binding protein